MKRHLVTIVALALVLTGCAVADGDAGAGTSTSGSSPQPPAPATQTSPAEPLDLAGEWVQQNSNSEDSYQAATITGEEIVVNWVNEADSSTALYWAGTYVPPTEDTEAYAWDSVNDVAQTETALLASDAPTKTFTFKGGVLMYELTAMGVTMTAEMSRQ